MRIFNLDPKLPHQIHLAAEWAEKFIMEELHFILEVEKFTYTEDYPVAVFNNICAHRNAIVAGLRPKVEVGFWVSKNPWSSARAQTNEKGFGVNRRKFGSVKTHEWTGIAVHEFCHVPCGYSHPFYNTKTRPQSVPYLIGHRAEEWARTGRLIVK